MHPHPPRVVQEPEDVVEALQRIGLSKDIVSEIAHAAAAARAESLPIDPVSAPGWFAYAHGIRHMRLRLLPEQGWRTCRDGNVESVVNDERGIQLCFQNVDLACSPNHIPRAISGKGSAARKQIAEWQGELFPRPVSEEHDHIGCAPTVWVICVESSDYALRAEVSCPTPFEGSQFDSFHERIFVVDERFDDIDPTSLSEDSDLEDLDVPVSKKL